MKIASGVLELIENNEEKSEGGLVSPESSVDNAPKRNRRKRLEEGLSLPLFDRLIKSDVPIMKDIEFRPVQNLAELQAASHLVYQEYLRCGYITPNKNEWKLSLYQILPTTVTFVAVLKKQHVLGTLTIVEDSPLGLPMDNLYLEELTNLRLEELHLSEISMLAMNRGLLEGEHPAPMSLRLLLVIHLFKAMFHYLRARTKVDNLVACFHPKHESMYKFLQLEPLGSLKNHPKVQGSPAVARHLDIKKAQQQKSGHSLYDLFYGLLDDKLATAACLNFSEDDLKKLFVDHSNILSSAAPEKLNHIRKCYPGMNIDGLIQSRNVLSYLMESLEQQNRRGFFPQTPPSTLHGDDPAEF